MVEGSTVKVVSRCPKCGTVEEFQIPHAGLEARAKGTNLREAFPELPEHRIQQLATNLCEKCQGKV